MPHRSIDNNSSPTRYLIREIKVVKRGFIRLERSLNNELKQKLEPAIPDKSHLGDEKQLSNDELHMFPMKLDNMYDKPSVSKRVRLAIFLAGSAAFGCLVVLTANLIDLSALSKRLIENLS